MCLFSALDVEKMDVWQQCSILKRVLTQHASSANTVEYYLTKSNVLSFSIVVYFSQKEATSPLFESFLVTCLLPLSTCFLSFGGVWWIRKLKKLLFSPTSSQHDRLWDCFAQRGVVAYDKHPATPLCLYVCLCAFFHTTVSLSVLLTPHTPLCVQTRRHLRLCFSPTFFWSCVCIPTPTPDVCVCVCVEALCRAWSFFGVQLWVSWCVLIGGSSRSMSLTGWITVITHYWLAYLSATHRSFLLCLSTSLSPHHPQTLTSYPLLHVSFFPVVCDISFISLSNSDCSFCLVCLNVFIPVHFCFSSDFCHAVCFSSFPDFFTFQSLFSSFSFSSVLFSAHSLCHLKLS